MEKHAPDHAALQTKALARWENEGGAVPRRLTGPSLAGEAASAAERSTGREAVAMFDTVEQLQAAVDELLESGFDRAELSLLAGSDTVESKIGHIPLTQIEDDPKAPRGVYVSPEAMGAAEGGLIGALGYVGGAATAAVIALAGGPLTAIVLGGVIAGGAGGLVGSGLAAVVGLHRAAYFDEQLARGGLLLWVRTWTAQREGRALEILRRHCGHDAHVHAFGADDAPGQGPVLANALSIDRNIAVRYTSNAQSEL
jgi:hypothetical protein